MYICVNCIKIKLLKKSTAVFGKNRSEVDAGREVREMFPVLLQERTLNELLLNQRH